MDSSSSSTPSPKKIVLQDKNDYRRKQLVSCEQGYARLLQRFGAEAIRDRDGYEVNDFGSLVDGSQYVLVTNGKESSHPIGATATEDENEETNAGSTNDLDYFHDDVPPRPLATLSTRPKTIHNLWEEYQHGIGDRIAARKFTARERGRCKDTYSRRNSVWKIIRDMVIAGFDAEIACDEVYLAYGKNKSVTSIIDQIYADKAKAGGKTAVGESWKHPRLRIGAALSHKALLASKGTKGNLSFVEWLYCQFLVSLRAQKVEIDQAKVFKELLLLALAVTTTMEDVIFHFMDQPPLSVKKDSTTSALYNDFWDIVLSDEKYLNENDRSRLAPIKEAIEPYWVSEFGCVVLVKEHSSAESEVTFVGLDDSKTFVHSSLVDAPDVRKRESVVDFGLLPSSQVEAGLRKFWGKLYRQRRLQNNAYFAFRSAMDVRQNSCNPFTNHTVPSNTSFPLVLSAVHAILVSGLPAEDEGEEIFNKCVSVYLLSKIESLHDKATSQEYCRDRINRCIIGVREMEPFLSPIKTTKFQEQILDRLEVMNKSLEKLAPAEEKAKTEFSAAETTVQREVQSLTTPKFPAVPLIRKKTMDKMQIKEEAWRNLNWSYTCDQTLRPFSKARLSIQDALVQMHQLNRYFWSLAEPLSNPLSSEFWGNNREAMLSKLKRLEAVTDKIVAGAKGDHRVVLVMIRSYRVLAHWVCLCWADHFTVVSHPVYKNFAPSMDPRDLTHLVLDDKRAINAVGQVRDYLEKRCASSDSSKPFTNTKDTMKLALAVARALKFEERFAKEMTGAEAFVTKRLKEIESERKKRESLTTKLTSARKNLKGAELQYSAVKRNMKSTLEKVQQSETIVASCSQNVTALEEKIKGAGSPPSVVAFRLPDEKELAMQWMFFMFMPDEFQILCTLTLKAQLQFWEEVPTVDLSEKTRLDKWFAEHLQGDSGIGDQVDRPALSLWAPSKLLDLSSPTSNTGYRRQSRVLFPNCATEALTPVWKGGLDIFAPRSFSDKARLFTEDLPDPSGPSTFLQQFVEMIPTKEKENRGIAECGMKPTWLTREQFCCFTSLRSAPRAQIRGLLHAICHDSLPFDHECVHVLIKQLLFQVGEHDWKTDLFVSNKRGLDVFAHALACRANQLKDAKKLAEQLLIFGVIASYFGQFHDGCLSCAREFAEIARKWGYNLATEYRHEATIPDKVHWNIAKYYAFALLCYPVTNHDESDLLACAELMVLFHHHSMMASSVEGHKSLHLSVTSTMAAKIERVVAAVEAKPWFLSRLVSLIREQQLPDSMSWSALCIDGNATGCFEAFYECNGNGWLFSVNLLNGMVLINGTTPAVLPPSVVNAKQYQRLFGCRNFEVEPIGFRHFRTKRFVDETIVFDFIIDESDILQIVEVDTKTGEEMVNIAHDSMDLPAVIRNAQSHWFSKNLNVVVSRGSGYSDRQISYVTTEKATFFVPKKYKGLSLAESIKILPKCERLLNGRTSLTTVLGRFERESLILHYVNADMTCLRYSLPRFNLDFEQRSDIVSSVQFRGYWLTRRQFLGGTLPGFRSFLVMQNVNNETKLLIPNLSFQDMIGGMPSDTWDELWRYHLYEIHSRLRHPVAADMEGRLLLALLYAWTSTLLPDPGIGRSGTTIATDLVRQSWKNEPLSELELKRLLEVSQLSGSINNCTLKLVCSWLYESSRSVAFLHGNPNPEVDTGDLGRIDVSARWQYRLDRKYAPRLLPHEESILLRNTQFTCGSFVVPEKESELSLFVQSTEMKLKSEFILERQNSGLSLGRCFPLDRPKVLSSLGEKIWDDLESSHSVYRTLPSKTLQGMSTSSDQGRIERIAQDVTKKRQVAESEILMWFRLGDGSVRHRLSLLTCQQRKVITTRELLGFLCDPSTLIPYVLHMGKQGGDQQYTRIRDWALLCVLEDKLQRIIQLVQRKSGLIDQHWDAHSLISELDCVRTWSPHRHPRWLAFEVEQEIQIRPQQYQIAKQLLENKGSIVQLNMGLGKTRVVVPMLIMELLSKKSRVRVNVLQPIMKEALRFYQNTLVASCQNIRIATLPFQRNAVPVLKEEHAFMISREIYRCSDGSVCLLVTPQHRNSLELKQHDEDNEFVPALRETFVDILDESDAILDSKVQLVFAVGKQVPLPDGARRWLIAQAFLKILSRTRNDRVRRILNRSDMVHFDNSECGSFPIIRFLRPFKKVQNEFGLNLCQELIQTPPRECQWMNQVPANERDTLLRMMADPAFDTRCHLKNSTLFSSYKSDILAVRGLIAFGLLFHGLSMRYRVDFGLGSNTESEGEGKLMAVPYEACDTPKARAEFSQPDMAILYTCVSYLREGLNDLQLKQALRDFQRLGPHAQASVYDEWMRHMKDGIPTEELSKFDDIRKIDIENRHQFCALSRYMHKSLDVVCFWLNTRLFPSETFQFPEKRASSAWNLATKSSVGFSGTDDNRFLIPLQVKQVAQASEELRATNGSMIECIIQCSRSVCVLAEKDGVPLWQVVLDECFKSECDALIDTGGLMAGSSKEEVLHSIISTIGTWKFKGFVFFNTSSEAWTVYEFDSKTFLPLCNSSLRESECFVYFDESRCRGSDLNLNDTASALVTLDASITKDKFLQGAARMRKLRPGMQSLILAGTHEAVDEGMTAKDVLQKIIDNTVRGVSQDLLAFYERGVEYANFPATISECIELDELYGGSTRVYDNFGSFLDAQHESQSYQTDTMKATIKAYCKSIGSAMPVQSTKLSQECERELEEEALCEMEFKCIKQTPFCQVDWDYDKAFTDPQSLFGDVFTPLHAIVKKYLVAKGEGTEQFSAVKWSPKLYCSSNFWKTIVASGPSKLNDLSFYLRLVNGMLVLQDGRVVLISAYELDKLLPYWWSSSSKRKRLRESGQKTVASIQHLFQYDADSLDPCLKVGSEETQICAEVLSCVKLFSGRVKFTAEELQVLKKAFCNVRDRQALILRLLVLRGRVSFFERSSLDDPHFLSGREQQDHAQESSDDASQADQLEKLEKAGISVEQLQILQAMGLKITYA